MSEEKEIKKKGLEKINLDSKDNVMKFLQQSTIKIAETFTGLLVSSREDWKLSAGKLIQAVIKSSFLTQLGREIEEYRDKGKIKEDYFATHKQRATLIELLKFIDEEVPDNERFNAIKSIFFNSIAKDASERDEILGYELLKLCRKLTSGDILVLKSCYRNIDSMKDFQETINWLNKVSEDIHLPIRLIELYEKNLMSLNLLSGRHGKSQDIIAAGVNGRITDLGAELYKFITKQL